MPCSVHAMRTSVGNSVYTAMIPMEPTTAAAMLTSGLMLRTIRANTRVAAMYAVVVVKVEFWKEAWRWMKMSSTATKGDHSGREEVNLQF